MAYVNCAICPAQALSTERFVYLGYLEEFKCISGHKTYIEKEGKPKDEALRSES